MIGRRHKRIFPGSILLFKRYPATQTTTNAAAQTAPVATAVSIADQIRSLAEQLKQGGLSREQKKQMSEQLRTLSNSEKISNFTKIVNELESKGIAQRLDKNCP
jgi:hypothetical protein